MKNTSNRKQELMTKYLQCVLESNKRINLTAIDKIEEARIKHLEDSLLGLSLLENLKIEALCDIGSGAGIPGVFLSIAKDWDTVLIDSSRKKIKTVGKILNDLSMSKKIKTFAGRIEEYPQGKSKFDLITARALSNMGAVLELSAPLLIEGGYLLQYKARPEDKELEYADKVAKIAGFELIKQKRTYLSDKSERNLFLYRKEREANIILPRKIGFAQRKPLH